MSASEYTLTAKSVLPYADDGDVGTPYSIPDDGMSIKDSDKSGCGPCCSYQVISGVGILVTMGGIAYLIAENWEAISKQIPVF